MTCPRCAELQAELAEEITLAESLIDERDKLKAEIRTVQWALKEEKQQHSDLFDAYASYTKQAAAEREALQVAIRTLQTDLGLQHRHSERQQKRIEDLEEKLKEYKE